MLMYLYIAALVLGGVLLGASLLLGGHDADGPDADGPDVDADVDADVELEADADGLDKDLDVGAASDAFWILRSFRFWMFFLAFFGLTGVTLDGLGLVDTSWITAVLSVVMGAIAGGGAATAFRMLASDETAEAAGASDYVGKSAKVLVAPKRGTVGKVRVEVKGQLVDLLATTEDEIGADDEVLVIEMDGTRARIARLEREE
ncbi:MAG: NfeD family protein [Sandaracinus sp.]|nr:NfeD family protein [Sandaracinus sp.]